MLTPPVDYADLIDGYRTARGRRDLPMPSQPASPLTVLAVAALAVGVLYVASAQQTVPTSPDCPDGKCPAPWTPPKPRVPWGDPTSPVGDYAPERGGAVVAGRTYQSEELSADLPGFEQFKNIGSRLDGAGMCVYSALEMAALCQGLEQMRGFRNWCADHYRGGGYPQKVEQLITAYCKAKGIEVPEHAQYEGQTPDEVLDLVDRTRRMACVTYGYGERYGGKTIAHMVNAPKCGSAGKYWAILDNNFPGEQSYEWGTRAEILKRIKHPSGKGWVFVWLASAFAPPPYN